MQLPDQFLKSRKLQTLVENQTSYTLENAALHVFETHQHAEEVLLKFDQPVLASMLRGKKVMHLRDENGFEFLPGESIVLPSEELMCIDFPEARMNNPTRCLAMAIDERMIAQIAQLMNEQMPRVSEREWSLMDYNFHFTNDSGIHQLIERLIYLFTEDHPAKDMFVNNLIQELIIRILQANSRKLYAEKSADMQSHDRMGFIVEYIRANIQRHMTVEELAEKACMSPSHFHRVFRNEFGIAPVEYINEERIRRAVALLQEPDRPIKNVYMECGFQNRSYFNRVFKKYRKVSPSQFQQATRMRITNG